MRKDYGITLIALVITIVVLIILASTAITMSLSNTGLFNRAKQAKVDYQTATNEEEVLTSKLKNDIDVQSNRGTVTLSEEEYKEFKRKGYTLLWEGVANEVNKTYNFIEPSMDIDDYDFILIEGGYYQNEKQLSSSMMLSKKNIEKNKLANIALWQYTSRYTSMYFVDNGFVVDLLYAENSEYVHYVKNIYGINM